jgi:hypothetical protein
MSSMTGQGNKIPKGYQAGQLQQFTPEQMQLFQSAFGNVGPNSYTGRLAAGDESIFNQIEAPALRQFSGVQGNIASRFSGMGQGGRHSSGFQNTINAASSDFAQDLQSRRMDLQRNAIRDLHGMSMDLLGQRPYENFLTDKKPSFFESIMGALGGGLGQFAGQAGGMWGINKMGLGR